MVCYLKNKYPDIQYLIGHLEYKKFKNSPLWLERDMDYQTQKFDPGSEFLNEVRKQTKN
jgi:hypothetical protein